MEKKVTKLSSLIIYHVTYMPGKGYGWDKGIYVSLFYSAQEFP